jgi:hypothetical protein
MLRREMLDDHQTIAVSLSPRRNAKPRTAKRLHKGASVTFVRRKINGEVWLPATSVYGDRNRRIFDKSASDMRQELQSCSPPPLKLRRTTFALNQSEGW